MHSINTADSAEVEFVRSSTQLEPEQTLTHRHARIDADRMYMQEKLPEDFPDGGKDAYLTLAGLFIGLIPVFGIPNSLGALEAYVATHQLANVSQSTVSWVFSLFVGVTFIMGVISGDLYDKYGVNKTMAGSMILTCCGLIATAELTKIWHFILSFSLLTGLGISIAMVPLLGVLSHWFLRKRAFACSVATTGGLVGSSVFAIMLQKLYSTIGYRWAIRTLLLVCGVLYLISIAMMKDRVLTNSHREEEEEEPGTEPNEPRMDWKIFLDIKFVSLAVAVSLSELIALTVLTYFASYAMACGIAESRAYLLITIASISGIFARLTIGILADKYGRFNIMLATTFILCIFLFSILLPARHNKALFYVFAVAYGCLSAAFVSLIGACLGQICPALKFGRYYGTLYFTVTFTVVLGMYVASLIIGDGSMTSYQSYVIFEAFVCLSAFLAWAWARLVNVGFSVCKF